MVKVAWRRKRAGVEQSEGGVVKDGGQVGQGVGGNNDPALIPEEGPGRP